jgi:ribosomal-protein-serine acetyltransferase
MNIHFDDFNIVDFDTKQSLPFFHLIDKNRVRLEDFFTGTVSKTKNFADTIDYCSVIEQKVKDKSYFPFIIISKAENKFIGLIDVKNIDWNVPKTEIGYFIDSNYEGKGIITKSLDYVIDYLVQTYQFKKLLCRVNSKNQGSINVAIKNKFQLEGTIRNDYRTSKNEIVDLNYYGRVF